MITIPRTALSPAEQVRSNALRPIDSAQGGRGESVRRLYDSGLHRAPKLVGNNPPFEDAFSYLLALQLSDNLRPAVALVGRILTLKWINLHVLTCSRRMQRISCFRVLGVSLTTTAIQSRRYRASHMSVTILIRKACR